MWRQDRRAAGIKQKKIPTSFLFFYFFLSARSSSLSGVGSSPSGFDLLWSWNARICRLKLVEATRGTRVRKCWESHYTRESLYNCKVPLYKGWCWEIVGLLLTLVPLVENVFCFHVSAHFRRRILAFHGQSNSNREGELLTPLRLEERADWKKI